MRGGDELSPRLLRQNVLASFSERAFTEEVIERRNFGRVQITLNRPDAIRHVLIDNAGNYGRTAATVRLLHPIVGDGIFLAEGEDWREQRRSLAPPFAPRTLPLLARQVGAVADETVARLAAARGPIDLLEPMHQLAIAVAGRAMFSLDTTEFGPRMRTMLRSYGEGLGKPGLFDLLLPVWVPVWRDLARRRFGRRWRALVGEIVAARRANGAAEGGDLFDLIASDAETGKAVPPARVIDQVATMIAAGHATTAVALFWTLYLVASVPTAQQAVADEAAALDLGPEGAAEALPRLVYAKAAVQEALRLYPPAYAIVRRALGADVAGGVAVPKGAVVMMAPWLLHRHRRLWDEPDRYDPARFLPGATPPDRFAYLPFGVGPRVCIGAQFALTEATLVLARLLQAFRIERADRTPAMPVAAITVRPAQPAPRFLLARR